MKTLFFTLMLCSGSAFSNPSKARLQEIKMKVENMDQNSLFNQVEVVFDLNLPNPAAAFFLGPGEYKISINGAIFNTLTKSAQNFIGFHELGHIHLGHTELDPKNKNRYELELEADAFAAFLYKRYGKLDKDFDDFLLIIDSQKKTVPPGDVRAKAIRSIVDQK